MKFFVDCEGQCSIVEATNPEQALKQVGAEGAAVSDVFPAHETPFPRVWARTQPKLVLFHETLGELQIFLRFISLEGPEDRVSRVVRSGILFLPCGGATPIPVPPPLLDPRVSRLHWPSCLGLLAACEPDEEFGYPVSYLGQGFFHDPVFKTVLDRRGQICRQIEGSSVQSSWRTTWKEEYVAFPRPYKGSPFYGLDEDTGLLVPVVESFGYLNPVVPLSGRAGIIFDYGEEGPQTTPVPLREGRPQAIVACRKAGNGLPDREVVYVRKPDGKTVPLCWGRVPLGTAAEIAELCGCLVEIAEHLETPTLPTPSFPGFKGGMREFAKVFRLRRAYGWGEWTPPGGWSLRDFALGIGPRPDTVAYGKTDRDIAPPDVNKPECKPESANDTDRDPSR